MGNLEATRWIAFEHGDYRSWRCYTIAPVFEERDRVRRNVLCVELIWRISGILPRNVRFGYAETTLEAKKSLLAVDWSQQAAAAKAGSVIEGRGVAERPQILDDIGVRWWCAVLGCVYSGADVVPSSQGVGFVERMALVAG